MITASQYLKIFLLEYYLKPSRYDYNIVFSRRLSGELDFKKLEFAFKKAIQESFILNSHLYLDNKESIYWQENTVSPKVSCFKNNLSKEKFIKTPFDLLVGPLYRCGLFKIEEEIHDLVVVLHHTILDGNSMDMLVDRLSAYYNDKPLKPLPSIDEQKQLITASSNALKENLEFLYKNNRGQKFWQRSLKDCSLNNNLPFIKPPQPDTQPAVKIKKFRLTKSLGLKNLSSQLELSYFNIFSTVWGILIARYCNGHKSNVLFPISIRNVTKELYGAYINSLISSIDISGNKTYEQVVSEYKKFIRDLKLKDSHKYSYYPIYDIVHSSGIEGVNISFAQTNLRNKKFNFQGCKEKLNNADEVEIKGTDLYLGFEEYKNSFRFKFYYDANLFADYQILELIDGYKKLLSEVSEDSSQVLAKVDLLSKSSRDKQLYTWNSTDKPYPHHKTIHSLFEEQVLKFPNNTAVVYEDVKLTYRELNEKANQLAHYLIKHHNIKPDDLVTLLLDRSEYMIIAILAVLKAGAAYVPMDPEYPDDRINYIFEDTNTDIVITNSMYTKRINTINNRVNIILIDDNTFLKQLNKYPNTNPKVNKLTSNNLAYIIYTSGTTGRPKGVQIEHKSVVNLALGQNKEYVRSGKISNYLAYANYIFDAHIWEIFSCLSNNHKLFILKQDKKKDIEYVSEYIRNNKINVALLPPILVKEKKEILDLKILILGGEKPSKKTVDLYIRNGVKVINAYGPTEATVASNICQYKKGDISNNIGYGIANAKAYVLSSDLLPLPIGAIGELYIGGLGLARGYLNKPGLTKEKFIPNPFQTKEEKQENKNSRLYKTGDLVRWLTSGELEYIGRNDFQVKIRGFRIELGEIESVLSEYKDIKQVAALAKENKETKYLVAYYTSDKSNKLNEEGIQSYLDTKLPDYMIPTAIVHLDKLPLTVSGKLDRKALLDHVLGSSIDTYVAPRNELEAKLRDIFASVLGLQADKVGINDEFFKLGGNSISAIKLLAAINSEFQKNIQLKELFDLKTVAKTALSAAQNHAEFIYKDFMIEEINQEELYEPFPMNNVQQAYYLGREANFELGNVATHSYVEAIYKELDVTRLEKALNKLIERHLALRTIFTDKGQQYLKNPAYVKIPFYELNSLDELIQIRTELSHKVYNPTTFPIFDFVVSRLDGNYVLHISIDAIIMDAMSGALLFKELRNLYADIECTLPELKLSYRDYLIEYEKIRESELFIQVKEYWENKIDDYLLDINLPLLKEAHAVKKPAFARVTKTIANDTWKQLLEKALALNISPTALLLCVYGKVLTFWSNQSKITINLTLFNRLPLHKQIHEIIGDFTVLELFNYCDVRTDTIKEILRNCHNELLLDIEHNLFDGIDLQRALRKKYGLSSSDIISPVVLTSVLTGIGEQKEFIAPVNDSYIGEQYSITQTPQVWLDNKAYNTSEGFVAEWDYVEELFARETIEAMHEAYCNLIEQLAKLDWDKDSFPNIELPTNDKDIIINANIAQQEICDDTLFGKCEQLIARQNLHKATAVIDANGSYSYAALLDDASKLAKYLYKACNGQELIAVLCEKGYGQVLTTFGIMKGGFGYLPLNVDWPITRISEILDEAGVRTIVLTPLQHKEKANELSAYNCLIINDVLQAKVPIVKLPKVKAESIAYVIFTSGSTGLPKGVTITHKNAMNTIEAMNQRFKMDQQDRVLALSELSFDLSVYDIYGMLSVGGTVVFPDQDKTKEPEHWLKLVKDCKVTIWNTVPQLAELLVDTLPSSKTLVNLRLVLLSGDHVPSTLAGKFKNISPNATIMTLGGATEGSIWSIWYDITNSDFDIVPYGLAMPNQKMYILNHSLTDCPLGVVGEIYIGGIGVALNYWKREDLTKPSFIAHTHYGKLYKTGDLGRWNKAGYMEFMGRCDLQVKVNGHRVELEEIAAKLNAIAGVEQAVVRLQETIVPDQGRRDYLTGYVIPSNKAIVAAINLDFDPEKFKLEQDGLIRDSKIDHELKPMLDEKIYRLSKSYRNFNNSNLDIDLISDTVASIIDKLRGSQYLDGKKPITEKVITDLLGVISGLQLSDRAFAKYRYPPAGSSYSIRCFINIPKKVDSIRSGYYYYHPTQHGLSRIASKQSSEFNLYLKANWEAIALLYGEKAKQFVLQEAGHMLSLLTGELELQGLGYEVMPQTDDTLVKLNVGGDKCFIANTDTIPKVAYLARKDFTYRNTQHTYKIERTDIFAQQQEMNQILLNGQCLLVQEMANDQDSEMSILLSGLLAQRISEELYNYNIGSCIVGLTPFTDAIYTMVLGGINDQDKELAESKTQLPSLWDIFSEHLQTILPEYMLPSNYVLLDTLPLTASGKIDTKQLPTLEFKGQAYVAPNTPLEKQLCGIWQEILSIKRVGIKDNFFRLGGDSIVSIQLVSRIRQHLNINYITIKDIFSYKTIAKLYDNIIKPRVNSKEEISIISEQGILTGNVPLLPIQKWFFNNNFEVPYHWNQAFVIKTPELDIKILQKCIRVLVHYHDAFRLRFSKKNIQSYDDNAKVEELKVIDVSKLSPKEELLSILTNLQSNFNLEKGPTYSIAYIHGFKDNSIRVFFALHHLIVDAVSWRILTHNLQHLYNQAINGQNLSLGDKLTSYRQWANAINNYYSNSVHSKEKTYWSNITKDIVDNNTVLNKLAYSKYNNSSFSISDKFTNSLLKQANNAYHTEINDLLLSALALALNGALETDTSYITLERHGREASTTKDNIDLSNTIGWFTSMYPVKLTSKDDIATTIKYIKETLREIPNKGIGYGAIIGYGTLPLISFNYLEQLDQSSNNDDYWSIINEDTGITVSTKNKDKNIININGAIINGILSFSIVSKLNTNLHNKLVTSFKQKLEEVITYTASLKRSYLTISDVNKVVTQEYLDRIQEPHEVNSVFLASSLQQGFIYHRLNQGDVDDAYIVQIIWTYNNKLAVNLLKKAWKSAQLKYPTLRLKLLWDNELIQVIDERGSLDWRFVNLSKTKNIKEQEKEILKIQQNDRKEPYTLNKGNLFRVYLIRQTETLYTCLFSNHHSILDGWSMPILLQYIHNTYLALLNNKPVDITLDQAYLDAQQYIQNTKDSNNQYWQNRLSKVEEYLNLNYLISNKEITNRLSDYRHIKEHKTKTLYIKGKLYDDLKDLSKREGITLNAILQFVWHKVLAVYGTSNSSSSTTIVGTTISGRELPINNIESSVGLYINTLPLIMQHNSNDTILDAINKLQNNITELNSRSNTNLAKLQKDGNRLFDTLFVYENYPTPVNNNNEGTLNIIHKGAIEKLDYPITVTASDTNKRLNFSLQYAGELFDSSTMERLLNTLGTLLAQVGSVLHNPSLKVNTLIYLNKKEADLILRKWNDTDKDYPSDKTIHFLFEEQVPKFPNNTAVVYEDIRLTYKELNEKANQLAHYLIKHHNIKPDDLVTLLLDRSEYMIIAILAVLKAGAAYVPMDPEYPDDRINYIFEDTNTDIVITNSMYTKRINTINNRVNIIPMDDKSLIKNLTKYSNTNPNINKLTSNNLAYVIYTSGTTGLPKGVQIEHKGIANLNCTLSKSYNLEKNEIILQLANYSFDASVEQIILALLNGNTLVCIPQYNLLHSKNFYNYLDKYNVSHIDGAPSLLTRYDINDIKSIKRIVFGGEKLENLANHAEKRNYEIINAYGITEVSITSTIAFVKNNTNFPIGRPISNSKAYVLSSDLSPLPVGAIGELYIGGVGLARGYLNKPELNNERFIPNPFQTKGEKQQNKNSRLYKTGDLVRWLPSGELEYIGRNDFQVKIRGFRIELGEIRSVINKYKGVKQAVILAKENKETNNKYLVAYYTSATGDKLSEDNISSYLATKLPDYMIPTAIVHMDKLPLTVNGKLDRKALPDPTLTNIDNYLAPRNELEIKLRDIFVSVLGLPANKVGINDDFFKLGGNSIAAIKLVNNINSNTPLTSSIADIFKYKNIKNLTQNIGSSKDIITIPISKLKQHQQPLSFAQERLSFIHKYEGGTNAYNIPFIYKLNSNTNIKHLVNAIHSTLKRHHILRSTIKEDSNNIYQVINTFSDKYFNKVRVKNSQELYKHITDDINYIFDLNTAYPIKVTIYSLEDTEKYISIVIHHIAFDGWSAGIFLSELYEFYNHYNNNTTLTLPKLDIQYKDFAIWQRNYLTGKVLDKQLNYWKKSLDGYENINLPTDYTRPLQVDYMGNNLNFTLDRELSLNLRSTAKELGVSLYTLLLASYYLMLKAYSNQDDIVTGTPIANRHYSQLQNLIGFFVNSLPIRINIKDKQNLTQFIKLLGDQIIDAQLHQDLPFEKLVGELKVEKDTSRHPIFQVMFGVQSFGENKQHYKDNILLPYDKQETKYEVAKFDVETFIDDSDEILRGSFNYRVSLYKESTIKRFINTYINILQQIAEVGNNKELTLRELTYLSKEEADIILRKWNDTDKDYPSDKTTHSLFEEQVLKFPNNTAVVYEDVRLTYKELNDKANQLANYLIKHHNIKPDTLVALLLDRSEYMIIAILGVLKAGAAYVPMDPQYPNDRIKYILSDTNTNLVIANNTYAKRINNISDKVNNIPIDDKHFIKNLTNYSNTDPKPKDLTSNNLAYVIYTSGTTGLPKGVLQIHANVIRLFTATQNLFTFTNKDVWTLFHSYIFDFSVWEIWGALIHAAKLIIPNKNSTKELNLFYNLCKKEKVTILNQTPCVFYQFSEIARNNNHIKQLKLRYIIFGGEALNYSKLTPWFDVYKYDNPKLVNMYGITETTVHVTYNKISKNTIKQSRNKIGKVIPDLKAYVLSGDLSPLPIGAIGELYIGGAGLARGYLNQPRLTKEKFIPNPFQTKEEKQQNKNSRLYKTGDLVGWLPSGELEYIGRTDFQIKIRGFRIELGEIESMITSYKGIKQAVVLAKVNKETKYLVAYYTCDSGDKLNETNILSYLATKLPAYMIPTTLMHLAKLPLTLTGKLDRKALPDLVLGSSTKTYVAPRNELEIKLRDIFASVLGLKADKVGINDDFFKLGGNSITAIKLVNNINQCFKTSVKVIDIFLYKNILSILNRIFQTKRKYTPLIKFDNAYNKTNLFMIHPGTAGCEVYISLANRLNQYFTCYGVDSYNLYSGEKIDNLKLLSQYYLSHIEKVMQKSNQNHFYLLGWSLGGKIALEIASILETKGYKNITLYLLDTHLQNKDIKNMAENELEALKLREEMIKQGYDKTYVDKVIDNLPTEHKLSFQSISTKLKYTKILLFKATLENPTMIGDQRKANISLLKSKYNNIDKLISYSTQLKVTRMINSEHDNILHEEERITKEIIEFKNNKNSNLSLIMQA